MTLLLSTAIPAVADKFEFRLAHPLQPNDITHTAMVSFADAVRERTDGRVDITVYPADQMGSSSDVGEMLVQGGAVIQFTDWLFLAEWVPDAGILQAPYLISDDEDWQRIVESEWMAEFLSRLQERNVRVLTSDIYFGSRSLLGPRPVRHPDDIEGATIRSAAGKMFVAMAESWGARPVVIGFGEVYTALAQSVIDFVEVPPQSMVTSNFTELRDVVSLTNHIISWNPLVMSENTYQELPGEYKEVMLEEAEKAAALGTRLKKESDAEIVEVLAELGMVIVDDVDRDAFEEASRVAYDAFADEWTPGLADTIRGIIEN